MVKAGIMICYVNVTKDNNNDKDSSKEHEQLASGCKSASSLTVLLTGRDCFKEEDSRTARYELLG